MSQGESESGTLSLSQIGTMQSALEFPNATSKSSLEANVTRTLDNPSLKGRIRVAMLILPSLGH